MENVREAYPDLRIPLELRLGEFSRVVMAAGVPMSSKGEGAFQTLSFGTFFNSESENACVLSLDFARQIAQQDPASLIGKSPTLSYAASSPNAQETNYRGAFQVRRVDLP